MGMDTMSDDVKQIAQRLSETRRFSIDGAYRRKFNNRRDLNLNNNMLTRMHSESAIMHQSPFAPFSGEFQMYANDKINNWMNRSFNSLHNKKEVEDTEDLFSSETGSDSSAATHETENKLPKQLQKQLSGSTCFVYDVPWDVSRCDIFIEVEKALLPVEKNFVCYVSKKLQELIDGTTDSSGAAETSFLKLDGYTLDELKTVLTYIYSTEEEQITDGNVASLLQLGDEFEVSRLIYRCDKYLRTSPTFNPFIMSHLAKQYKLDSLLDYAYCDISKIDNVEDTQEFQRLDDAAQNHILKFLLTRYKKASKTLSQFDVHLCKHHGDDPKNNQCCFRAATYATENNRTFLIQIESPEEGLVKRFNSVLSSENEHEQLAADEEANEKKNLQKCFSI